jgi:hypothetical protein
LGISAPHVKFAFPAVLLSLLLTACDRRDPKSRNPLVGTWAHTNNGSMTLVGDGTFYSRWTNFAAKPATDWSYDGTWEVEDGFLVCVVTNAEAHNTTNVAAVGGVERYSILRIDKARLVTESGGQTSIFERR